MQALSHLISKFYFDLLNLIHQANYLSKSISFCCDSKNFKADNYFGKST